MSNKIRITQSMIKEFADYKFGKVCGLQFKAKYLDGVKFESSPVQKLGQYFEYIATGAKTKHGEIPQPEKNTRGDNKGELKTAYQRMVTHVQTFHKMLKRLNLKPLSVGKVVKYKNYEGTWDVELVAQEDINIPRESGEFLTIKKGEKIILDLKTTGMMDNKWDDLGWDIDSLSEKEKLMFQPIMYVWLGQKAYNTRYHFIFNVYSNTNDIESKLIYIEIDDDRLERVESDLEKATTHILREIESGFIARPTVKDCFNCPVKDTCDSFIDIPSFNIVQIS